MQTFMAKPLKSCLIEKKKAKYITMLIHSVNVPFAGYYWAAIIYCWWKVIAGLSFFIHVGKFFVAIIFHVTGMVSGIQLTL